MTPTAMTATQAGEFRAAGTDLSERRRSGVSTGPLIDISAAPDTIGMHWGADGQFAHRRLHHHCRHRRRRAHRRGLSGHCRIRARSGDAADPPPRDPRRQSRATFALLVFSQSAYRLPEERRVRLSGAIGQSSLSRQPSTSAPAWRRIPRRWRRRCWPMKRK